MFVVLFGQRPFYPAVGDKPKQRYYDEDAVRYPRMNERKNYGGAVKHVRKFAFPIASNSRGEERINSLMLDNAALQNHVCDSGQQKNGAISCSWFRCKMGVSHPGGRDGKQ